MRMLTPLALVLGPFLCAPALAQYKVGDTVIVIHDQTPIKRDGAVVQSLNRGVNLRVNDVDGESLWVSHIATGWMEKEHVTTQARALDVFNLQIKDKPDDATAYLCRGMVLHSKNELDKAIADYNEAIRIDRRMSSAFLNRGNCWYGKQEYDRALADYTEAVRLAPADALAYGNRANTWNKKSEYERAIADAADALQLAPGFVSPRVTRMEAWIALNEFDKVFDECDAARKIDRTNVYALELRAVAWAAKKKFDKALADCDEARRENSRSQAHDRVARLLATHADRKYRNARKAIEFATAACEISNWKNWACLTTLAASFAEAGDFEKAIEYQEKAIALTAESGRADLQKQLDLYKSRRPFHEKKVPIKKTPVRRPRETE